MSSVVDVEISQVQGDDTKFIVSQRSVELMLGNSAADTKTASSHGGKGYADGSLGAGTAVVGFVGEAAFRKYMEPDSVPQILLGEFDNGVDGALRNLASGNVMYYDVKTATGPRQATSNLVLALKDGRYKIKPSGRKGDSVETLMLVKAEYVTKISRHSPRSALWETPVRIVGFIKYPQKQIRECETCLALMQELIIPQKRFAKGQLCEQHGERFSTVVHGNGKSGVNVTPKNETEYTHPSKLRSQTELLPSEAKVW